MEEVIEKSRQMVGVSFRRCGKIYMFDPGELQINPGDWVVVETIRGQELGQVMRDRMDPGEEDEKLTIKPVIRKATPEDMETYEENKYRSAEAFRVGIEKIRENSLPMKLVDVEYTLDQSKIVFYFSAEGRVDFRALVRDLASVFHKRIELHQIGVRDVAKMLGGLGPCGLTCCCATFLHSFDPVSIKMAKEQNLSLNSMKISGPCGRLLCCLSYEFDFYVEEKRHYPPEGSKLKVGFDLMKVIEVNILSKKISLSGSEGRMLSIPQSAVFYNEETSRWEITREYADEFLSN